MATNLNAQYTSAAVHNDTAKPLSPTSVAPAAGVNFRASLANFNYLGVKTTPDLASLFAQRFAMASTPALAQTIREVGPLQWLNDQLFTPPSEAALDKKMSRLWPTYKMTDEAIGDKWGRSLINNRMIGNVHPEYRRVMSQQIQIAYGAWTPRQAHATLVFFMDNHFSVDMIRSTANYTSHSWLKLLLEKSAGKFSDLVYETTKHPVFASYLDNHLNQKGNINENLGRELLELHTLGVNGGYTEKDVLNSALTLTGFGWSAYGTRHEFYNPNWRHTGDVQVLGWSDRGLNSSTANAHKVLRDYTTYLARHPSTADYLARKLIQFYVTDIEPPRDFVNRVAQAYLRADTDVRYAVMEIARSPEFAASSGNKTKTPQHLATSAMATVGFEPIDPNKVWDPVAKSGHTNARVIAHIGEYLHRANHLPRAHPSPNGYPMDASHWFGPSNIVGSFNLLTHIALAADSEMHSFKGDPMAFFGAKSTMTCRPIADLMRKKLLGNIPVSTYTMRQVSRTLAGGGVDDSKPLPADPAQRMERFQRATAVLLCTPYFLSR